LIGGIESAGVDTITVDSSGLGALANANFTFDAGTDVLVNGTAFLSSAPTHNMRALLGDADVTVALTSANTVNLLAGGSDAQFDALIDDLQAAGMDTLSIDAGQAAALALSDANFTLDAGTDVLVNGTAFLSSAPAPKMRALLGDADVTVALSASDMQSIAGGTPDQFNALIDSLQAAGMDTLSIDAGQVAQLSEAGFTFDADVDVVVTGTAFLGGTSAPKLFVGDEVTQAGGDASAAHVAVKLTGPEIVSLTAPVSVQSFSPDADARFDDLIQALKEAGVDEVVIDGADVASLEQAGITFANDNSAVAIDVKVVGEGFLKQFANEQDAQNLDVLDGASHVTLEVSDALLQTLGSSGLQAMATFGKAAAVGVDQVSTGGVVELTAAQALVLHEALSDAVLEFTDEVRITDNSLSLNDITNAGALFSGADPAADVQDAFAQLVGDLESSGFDKLYVDQGLLDALGLASGDLIGASAVAVVLGPDPLDPNNPNNPQV
jgi:hypothetical protein